VSRRVVANLGERAMKLPRRRFLRLAAGAAAVPLLSRGARAQTYPTRPVRIIVGFPPGGPTDIAARLFGQYLSERLGQQFFVENRAGASGNIGAEAVAKAAPDGYTLLHIATNNAINASLYENLNFNFIRDIAPVAGIMRIPNILEVNPSIPANTVPEFIALAKANPGTISFGAGSATSQHVSGELFAMMAGVKILFVPYRGSGPALTDLMGGHLSSMFDAASSSIAYIRAGKLRPLAVTTATRIEVLPDVPTIAEFLPGYEASGWHGTGAPANTPPEIIERLNNAINAALADPRMQARIADLGGTVLPGTPAQFGKLLADETEKWAKVVKFAGLKPE
jgi:tripartite-type tricarboxylate transporter receptor subunit TctC